MQVQGERLLTFFGVGDKLKFSKNTSSIKEMEDYKMKRILAAVLALVMVVGLSACSAKKESTPVAGASEAPKGTLVMATNAEFPPYEFREGDEIVGIDVEISRAIAEDLGMELKIEDMKFDSIIPAVISGKADFGAAGMTVTEDRLKNVNFSEPYAHATQVVIVKEGSEVATPDDLEGKKVGVQLGTTGDIYAADIKDVDLQRFDKGFEAVQALTQDKVDAVIIDNEPAKVFVSQNEGLKILDEAFTEEDYALAIAKDNTELLDKVNASLKKLKESGKFDEIVAKYIKAE